MQKIVATILHAAGGSQIRILRTVAHGDSEVYNFPYLWNANLVSEEYKQLRRVFAPNARFELHGCGVASETSILKPGVNMRDARVDNTVSGTFSGRSDGVGLVYLRRVSSVFGIQVAAGINVQTVSQKSWRFEGDTLTVFPNGKFVIDSEGTRLWDIASHQKAAKEYLRMTVNRIAQGQLVQARQDLQNLIRNYSQTSAAREAADRLKNPDLQPTPLEVMPDGSLRLN